MGMKLELECKLPLWDGKNKKKLFKSINGKREFLKEREREKTTTNK